MRRVNWGDERPDKPRRGRWSQISAYSKSRDGDQNHYERTDSGDGSESMRAVITESSRQARTPAFSSQPLATFDAKIGTWHSGSVPARRVGSYPIEQVSRLNPTKSFAGSMFIFICK